MRKIVENPDTVVVNTFPSSTIDRRTKLQSPLVRRFSAKYRDSLYFYRDAESIVVTTKPRGEEEPLFQISVDVENRARLTETNLKQIGAMFHDKLEFTFTAHGEAVVRVIPQQTGQEGQQYIQPLQEVNGSRETAARVLSGLTEQDDVEVVDYWSDDELRLTIESYFQMLMKELQDEAYSKTTFKKELLTKIRKTGEMVEDKYRDISGALLAQGLRNVEGYKSASDYQGGLDDAVITYIGSHTEILQLVAREIENTAVGRPEANFNNVLEDPPEQTMRGTGRTERKRSYIARKYDFSKRENEKLGRLGEEFVVGYERQRLTEAGKADLAEKVERISETKGDGAGYDVLSFEVDGTERYIEVKTTNYGKDYPFYISANELDFSEDYSAQYHLYRVFNFKNSPKMFMLTGSLKDGYEITPATFRVSF
jgi:hypothetical protein